MWRLSSTWPEGRSASEVPTGRAVRCGVGRPALSQAEMCSAIVLATLHQLGYAVEWRVVNAADYGVPQIRNRVILVAFRGDSGQLHVLDAYCRHMGAHRLRCSLDLGPEALHPCVARATLLRRRLDDRPEQ